MTKPESGDDLEKAMKNLSKAQGILATSSSPAAEPGKRGRGRPWGQSAKSPRQPSPDLRAWVGGLVPDGHHQH